MNPFPPERMLVILLRLVAVHSALVCIAMILVTESILKFLGYHTPEEAFFRVQAGIFHLVMAVAYWLGSTSIRKHSGVVLFSIFTKLVACTFLLTYFFFVDPIEIVLLSAVGDGIMGIVLLWSFRRISYDRMPEGNRNPSPSASMESSLKTQSYSGSGSL